MKILINCINLLSGSQGAGGAGSYVYSLVLELAQLETVRILVKPDNFLRFQKIKNLQVIPLINHNIELIQIHLAWADIYFCPLNELVPQYFNSNVPIVSTILDLQHEVYPHYFKNGVYESRRVHYGYAIARANGILTISNHEKNLIQKIYNKKDVYVTYLSGYLADQFTDETAKNQLNQTQISETPYLIYPAIPWRHKNHYRLVEALYILKKNYPEFKDLKLILTGAKHSLSSSNLENLINDLQMQNHVEMKGFVSDLELATLIKNAQFMVFPSLYEGFGIPIVDAMKLGTPVLTTPCTAIPEVAGDTVNYMQNPLDSQQIAKDIYSLLTDEEKCADLRKLGYQQGEKYSSVETAKATINAFQEIIEKYQKDQVNLDYINVKAVPEYRNTIKSKKISLIFDLTELDRLEESYQKLREIGNYWENLVQIITLLPIKKNLEDLHLKDSGNNFLKIYCDRSHQSYYFNSLNYLFDSVINTDYVMYCDIEETFNKYRKVNLVEAMTMLDNFQHLTAIAFTEKVKYPVEISPLSDVKLLQEYDYWKPKRLEFFNLIMLRSENQNSDYHLGQYKFLSKFLSESVYLKYPII